MTLYWQTTFTKSLCVGYRDHIWYALTFARLRESCLITLPNGIVFKHHLRDLASFIAMKQTCLIVNIAHLPDFNLNHTEHVV